MSSNFDCFVQINGNKYDISIDNFEFSTVFEYIYPKMKQIVEIAENIDIDLKTYDFVVSFITWSDPLPQLFLFISIDIWIPVDDWSQTRKNDTNSETQVYDIHHSEAKPLYQPFGSQSDDNWLNCDASNATSDESFQCCVKPVRRSANPRKWESYPWLPVSTDGRKHWLEFQTNDTKLE